jgi:hypothetical protein
MKQEAVDPRISHANRHTAINVQGSNTMKAKMSVIAVAVAASVSGAGYANEVSLFDVSGGPTLAYEATSTIAAVSLQGIMPNPDWEALAKGGPETTIYLGGDIQNIDVAQVALDLTFSFVDFKEVSWLDTFEAGGNVISNQGPAGQSFTVRYMAGEKIDIKFTSQMAGEATPRSVANGSNGYYPTISDPSQLNFAALRVSGGLWYLGLEDGLVDESNGPDYDDLIIRVDAKLVEVPEPGSMALLGLGAVGVGLTRMKRKQSA